MARCERCKDFIWGDSCRCEEFLFIERSDGNIKPEDSDFEDEYQVNTVYAVNHDEASRKALEELNDEGDYVGECVVIDVMDKNKIMKSFAVSAEPSIDYHSCPYNGDDDAKRS